MGKDEREKPCDLRKKMRAKEYQEKNEGEGENVCLHLFSSLLCFPSQDHSSSML